jgi:hypothetical protein
VLTDFCSFAIDHIYLKYRAFSLVELHDSMTWLGCERGYSKTDSARFIILTAMITRILAHLKPLAVVDLHAPPRIASLPDHRRAMVTLTSAIAVFAVLHFGLVAAAEFSRTVRDPIYADKERKLARLERVLPPASPMVVFIGTSRTGNGFEAGRAQEVLTESLGHPSGVFNWGIPASGPVTHLLHLKRLLIDRHRPALLLLEIHPPMLADFPDGLLEGRFADGIALEWNELEAVAGYRFPIDSLYQSRREVITAPWYAMRFRLMGRLSPTTLPFPLRYDWSRGPDPNGWSPIQTEEVTEQQRTAGVTRAGLEYRNILAGLTLGEAPVRALHDLLDLCRNERIPAMLVWMPEGTSFRALYPSWVTVQLEHFLGGLSAEYGCGFCSAREWMPDSAFIDGHHLLRQHAGISSERLTREAIEPFLRSTTGGKP